MNEWMFTCNAEKKTSEEEQLSVVLYGIICWLSKFGDS